MKIGVTQWSLDEEGPMTIKRASDLGFSYIHVDAGDPDSKYYLGNQEVLLSYIDMGFKYNISIIGVALNYFEISGIESDFCIERNSFLSLTIQNAIKAAALFSSSLIYLPSFKKSEITSFSKKMDTIKILKTICLYAEPYNILVASENTMDGQKNKDLFNVVDKTNFRILLDLYNPILWHHSVIELIRINRSNLAPHVHVKDGTDLKLGNARLGKGEGQLQASIYNLLKRNSAPIFIFENDYSVGGSHKVKEDINLFKEMVHAYGL